MKLPSEFFRSATWLSSASNDASSCFSSLCTSRNRRITQLSVRAGHTHTGQRATLVEPHRIGMSAPGCFASLVFGLQTASTLGPFNPFTWFQVLLSSDSFLSPPPHTCLLILHGKHTLFSLTEKFSPDLNASGSLSFCAPLQHMHPSVLELAFWAGLFLSGAHNLWEIYQRKYTEVSLNTGLAPRTRPPPSRPPASFAFSICCFNLPLAELICTHFISGPIFLGSFHGLSQPVNIYWQTTGARH